MTAVFLIAELLVNDSDASVALLDFLRPKWKRSDPAVRKAGVEALIDPALLAEIAIGDDHWDVRLAAVRKLDNPEQLRRVAMNAPEHTVAAAIERIQDARQLARIATETSESKTCIAAVEQIDDQAVLADLALQGKRHVRQAAVKRVADAAVLRQVLEQDQSSMVRPFAADRLQQLEAEAGDSQALFELADRHLYPNTSDYDPVKGADLLRKAADKEHAQAARYLGGLYLAGEGVEQDDTEALQWLSTAAELDNAEAMNLAGVLYHQGRGTDRDCEQAARWFRRAAELGNNQSRTNLANLYLDGEGVERDEAAAVALLESAAEDRFPEAQLLLADLLTEGRGVTRDPAAARALLRKADEEGVIEARQRLTRMDLEQARQAGRLKVFQNREVGFSLDHPTDWDPYFPGGVLQFRSAHAEFIYEMDMPVHDPCLNVIVAERPHAERDAATILQGFIDQNAADFYLFEQHWQAPFELLSGQPAIEYSFRFNLHLTWIGVVALITAREDKLVLVSVMGALETMQRKQEDWRLMVRSFIFD